MAVFLIEYWYRHKNFDKDFERIEIEANSEEDLRLQAEELNIREYNIILQIK